MLNIKNRKAFTMIELIFVIVVLGILASVAIPKLAATRTDAQVSKGRADVSSIRSGIMTQRQSKLITGNPNYIAGDEIDNANGLFGGVLTYGITDSATAGHWTHSATAADVNSSKYMYNVAGEPVNFEYTRSGGIFTCSKTTGTDKAKAYCANLID